MNCDGYTYLKAYCLSDSLNYTKYFFKQKTGRRFVVNSHHKLICDALNDVLNGKITKLIINIAPRYSKTELAVKNFISMGLAINPSSKFIHLSYSDDLAHDNSEEIRDIVKSVEYQSLFPYVSIKKDSDSKKKWSTTEGGGVYAVATGGQVTGFGAGAVDEEKELEDEIESIETSTFAGAIVIDDPIKPEDALSDIKRDRVNNRFETTIRNRVNSRNTPIIIIMQRLHEDDLCGYLQKIEPDDWTVLSIPCISLDKNGNEVPLWEFKHSLEELHKIERANPFVFDTQYMQNPTPIEGLMYREFQTYDTIPYYKDSEKKNYTDTADTGSDYLCSICYVDTPIGNFVTDVLYTQKPMEYTEPKTAEMITRNATDWVDVESNNGGRGFARNVEKQCREMGNTKTFINWFCQTDNKQVRIFTKSADVNNMTFFPVGWERKWPEFHNAITKHRKEGSNSHDDAPDALTGCFEKRKIRVKKQYSKEDLGIF
jgi:predicted phage terminase large subunit-like protein